MDSRLFESKLTSHKMFKDLKDCFTESTSNKLTNLLELKDDVFYVWNPAESCLMCLNLKHLEEHGDETPYQKLHMVSPPSFAVERVVASACGSRVCVWGARGVCVAELPARWGRAGLFDSGNQSILCKSWCVDERLLYCQGEVRRVHWHPDSLSHLIVLVSDNSLRVYNIAMKGGPKLVKCVSVGPKPAGALAGRALLDSLGDTAVDFTPVPDSRDLLVLRGNGDLYLVSAQLEQLSGGAKVVRGPLAMYPPADDNYGSESCSVACVGGGADPPLVVVATCSAQLYHCLLLPNPECECEADSHALYVIEAVELAVPAADALHSYPVQLLPCSSSSYVCVHAGGVHTVSLPLLGHLAELAAVDDERAEGVVVSLLGARSGARHAVRTRRAAGLALSRPPLPALLLLTEAGELLYRTLEPFELEEQLYRELQLRNPALEQRDRDQLLDERARLSFSALMLEILRRDVSQPVLRLAGGRDPDPAQCLEVVSEATLKLRSEYMSRQARAAAAARDKLAALAARAARHRAWLHTLQGEAEEVRAAAAALRDKCLLAEKHQDDLQYRCSAAARRVRGGAPTGAERALLAELAEARCRAQHHAHQLAALRQLVAARNQQLKTWKEDYKRKDLALGKSHSDSIASVLQQQTSQISSLIEETKLLKDQLSIV